MRSIMSQIWVFEINEKKKYRPTVCDIFVYVVIQIDIFMHSFFLFNN